MLYANKNVESVGEKTIETNKLGQIESLLNHMDLDNEININSPINTKIREWILRWIESVPSNIIEVKIFIMLKLQCFLTGYGW